MELTTSQLHEASSREENLTRELHERRVELHERVAEAERLRIARAEAEAACTEAQAQASACRSELEEYHLAISHLQSERAAHAKVSPQTPLIACECSPRRPISHLQSERAAHAKVSPQKSAGVRSSA